MIALACGAVARGLRRGWALGWSPGVRTGRSRPSATGTAERGLAARRRGGRGRSEVATSRSHPCRRPASDLPGPSTRSRGCCPATRSSSARQPGGSDRRQLATRPSSAPSGTSGSRSGRDGWLGVPVAELPNGVLGWIATTASASRSSRPATRSRPTSPRSVLTLRYGKRVLERFGSGVGGAGTPTPPGAYAVTDGLPGEENRPLLRLLHPRADRPPAEPAARLDRRRPHRDPRHPGRSGSGSSSGCLRASDTDDGLAFCPGPARGAGLHPALTHAA